MLSMRHLSELLRQGIGVAFKHYSMRDFTYAIVDEIRNHELLIRTQYPAGNSFFPGDAIVLHHVFDNKYYIISSVIKDIDCLLPLKCSLRISKIEELDNYRKDKRIFVSLVGAITADGENDTFAVIGNIGYEGVMLNTRNGHFRKYQEVLVSIEMEPYGRMDFSGSIVRKKKYSDVYEYGIKIIEISEINNNKLRSFLNENN